jgi:hypothetical protein
MLRLVMLLEDFLQQKSQIFTVSTSEHGETQWKNKLESGGGWKPGEGSAGGGELEVELSG